MRAREIIEDAYERCNRLSPGETLGDDDASRGLRRLNLLVDELSAKRQFLFRQVLTSAAQIGNITLGTGAWASIEPSAEVVSATANNLPLSRITMQQYNELYQPAVGGLPSVWAQDGLSTVYLWPVPNGQTIKLLTREGVTQFADGETEYLAANGWKSALGAALAVRIAPFLLARMPPELLRAEQQCMAAVECYEPAVVDVHSYSGTCAVYPPRLF